jgi:hypothetical protein
VNQRICDVILFLFERRGWSGTEPIITEAIKWPIEPAPDEHDMMMMSIDQLGE